MDNEKREYTFLWFIENYSYCWHKNGERLVSPYFTADGLEGSEWRVNLYPRGERDEDKKYISLYLCRRGEDDGPENLRIKYELSILAENDSEIRSTEDSFPKCLSVGWPKFLKLDVIRLRRKADFLPHDILTVRCKIWKGEGSVHKVAPISARTRIAIENISFLHVEKNFNAVQPNQKKTIEIQSQSKKGYAVSSSLYFTDDSCPEGKIIHKIRPSDNNYILCKQKISLLDGSGNIIGCGENDDRLDVKMEDIQELPLSISRQDVLTKNDEYLPDEKLTLLCECSFSNGLEFEKIEGTQNEISTAAEDLNKNVENAVKKISQFPSALEDMKTLYITQCLTDVELKTETKSFPAHKSVLCARSPVFKAMLTSDLKEKYDNCIQVDDLEDDIVQQLLLFLYSDNIENIQRDAATQLYYAADKYQIGRLRELCSSFLEENLTATNAGELLLLADTHYDTHLRKIVEDFILKHENQVFSSKEWEKLMETNPMLAMKTLYLKYKR